MSSWGFAPKITNTSFTGSGTTELEDGLPIRIWGYTLTNTNASATRVVTLRASDNSKDYVVISVTAGETVVSDVKWIADRGLEINSDGADIEAAVFHSHPGS